MFPSEHKRQVHNVKYMQKYIHNGHDCMNIHISGDDNTLHHNEIPAFLNMRYVDQTEAAYRILSYSMHEHSNIFIRLYLFIYLMSRKCTLTLKIHLTKS